MKKIAGLTGFLLTTLWLLTFLNVPASADVAPGDVIDKTNWEKAEGLLPASVLDWVKKGDFVLQIGKLSYNTEDYFPDFQEKAFKTDVGKYGLDADNGIIDVKTGKLPKHVSALPFSKIDPDDPKLCEKVMYNSHYMTYQRGSTRLPAQTIAVNRSGLERESDSYWYQLTMDGNPKAVQLPNPKGIEKKAIAVVRKPYDVAGTAVMLWRFMSPTQEDTSFGYIPAIRRVRRMSPANRSDAFMGSDMSMDDANGYDGKITAFTWKLLRKQDGIIAYLSADPVLLVKNEAGEWHTTPAIRAIPLGFQVKGWQGAPWAPTNLVWVKRPVYVFEMTPKDPYYNYGPQELWVDVATYAVMYKVINDKARNYWKTFYTSSMCVASEDKAMKFWALAGQYVIDDRTHHSTIVEDASPRNIWNYWVMLDPYDFTLGGFQKFCK